MASASAKIIKLSNKDDLATVIRQIKTLREDEVTFLVDKGSPILSTFEGMKRLQCDRKSMERLKYGEIATCYKTNAYAIKLKRYVTAQ